MNNENNNFNQLNPNNINQNNMNTKNHIGDEFIYKPIDLNLVNDAKFDNFELKDMIHMFEKANLDVEDLSFKKINKMHLNLKDLIKNSAQKFLNKQNLFVKTINNEKHSSKIGSKRDDS
jgi:hypothetical protein